MEQYSVPASSESQESKNEAHMNSRSQEGEESVEEDSFVFDYDRAVAGTSSSEDTDSTPPVDYQANGKSSESSPEESQSQTEDDSEVVIVDSLNVQQEDVSKDEKKAYNPIKIYRPPAAAALNINQSCMDFTRELLNKQHK